MSEKKKVTVSSRHSFEDGLSVAETSAPQRRTTNLQRLLTVLMVATLVTIGFHVLLYVQTGTWHVLVAGGGFVLAFVFLIVARGLVRRAKPDAALSRYWILGALLVAYGGSELAYSGATLYLTVGGILLTILVGSIVLPRKWGIWLVAVGLYGAYILMVNRFEPLPRFDVEQSTWLRFYMPGLTVALTAALLWQIAPTFHIGTIRTRLLVSFTVVTLVAAAVIATVSVVVVTQNMQAQVIAQLESVATLKEAEIRTWVN